jgi:hypothetical protein
MKTNWKKFNREVTKREDAERKRQDRLERRRKKDSNDLLSQDKNTATSSLQESAEK